MAATRNLADVYGRFETSVREVFLTDLWGDQPLWRRRSPGEIMRTVSIFLFLAFVGQWWSGLWMSYVFGEQTNQKNSFDS